MATEFENVKQDNPTSQESAMLFSKAYTEARKRERADLLEHLRQLGLPIIEDDPYKTLVASFEGYKPKRLSAIQALQREAKELEKTLEEYESAIRLLQSQPKGE